jgi:oligopeptide transport system substrate-binding protein
MLPSDAPVAPAPAPALGRARIVAVAMIALIAVSLVLGPVLADLGAAFPAAAATPTATHEPGKISIAMGSPETLDPAVAGDAGSAALIAQVFEGLTTVDADLVVRPALAESWTYTDGGRTAVFTLRDGLTFSDGTPLTAEDVKRSWLRVLDPAAPSPLASLLDEVEGAADYQRGRGSADAVGLEADGRTFTVRFARPSTDFAAVAASPTLAVVPPAAGTSPDAFSPRAGFVGSGGYLPVSVSPSFIALTANDRYWAGTPAIGTVEVVTSLDGTSPVEAFRAGDVDLTQVYSPFASWLSYDPDLGSSLREGVSVNLEYLGFDTSAPPFDDARVRQAFAKAVDWRRVVALGSDGSEAPATGMIPPAIPDRSSGDFLPAYDPDGARALLAEAGHPGGQGLPTVTFITNGNSHAAAIAAELERNLGVDIALETMDFTQYFDRLAQDPPGMWIVDWVADYPGRTAILRLLLGSDQQNNFGRWSSADFDAALDAGSAATESAGAAEAFDLAEGIVRDEAPVVPLSYGTSYWLARDGLLGAGENGLGFVRFAGLAWADR